MLKVVHFVESDLLRLVKDHEVTMPPKVTFKPNDCFIIDTETNSALAEIVGILNNNRYILRLKEVQKKLFMPFFWFILGGFSTFPLIFTITI